MVGKVSPRAFVEYHHETPQDPTFFREILQNSLDEAQISQFCADFLRLFAVNKKQHKERVPCLIGASGSGKTSLFFPVLAIVKPQAIAKVTKQKCFNKSMIGPDTQVIFLDEASEKTMDVDDWKLLTQGGFTAHDSKYAKSRGFMNKCPMLITCQKEMQFGDEDREAMDARLNKYFFKSLPSLNHHAAKWLKTHAMDCIVWAQEKASALQAASSEGDCDQASESSTDEMNFDEEEVAAIKKVSVLVSGAQQPAHDFSNVGETSDTVEDEEQPESIEDMLAEWEDDSDFVRFHTEVSKRLDALGNERNLRWQILVAIKENFEGFLRKARDDQRARARMARRTREQVCIDMGVENDLVRRMPEDPVAAYPETLQRAADRCAAEMNAASDGQMAMHAKQVFEGVWLQLNENELVQLAKDVEASQEDVADVRRAKEYLLEVASDALRLHHASEGTDPQLGLEARRKMYVENGWLAEGQESRVTDLHSPPDLQQVGAHEPKLLLTPPSSQPKSQQRKRKSATQIPIAAGKQQRSMRDFLSKSQH